MSDQLAPFHRSTNVVFVLRPPSIPTAKQASVLGHETPHREADGNAVGLGLGVIDQRDPSQCSANVFAAEVLVFSPTAKQLPAFAHDTPLKKETGSAFGFG